MILKNTTLRLFTLIAVSLVTFGISNADSEGKEWYETAEWYENALDAQKNEANPVHLAITLTECFSHNPKDFVALNKAIKFWISRGGDINKVFNIQDYLSFMCRQQDIAQLVEFYKNKPVTLLKVFVGADTIVKALLENQASVIINNESALNFWAEQYAQLTKDNNEIRGCSECIDMVYQSHHRALRILFAASNKQDQIQFLDMHPNYKNIIDGGSWGT